jgi:hypothetical protein
MNVTDTVNDPAHYAGPGRGTLGVFYGAYRKPTKYYAGFSQQTNKLSYKTIRDYDAGPRENVNWWANITYDPQTDPHGNVPTADACLDPAYTNQTDCENNGSEWIPGHVMGTPEYFTIPTFDPPVGGDTVTITQALFNSILKTLDVTATNITTGVGYELYAIHSGKSQLMTEGPVGTWNTTLTGYPYDISDNMGRVYVISIDPSSNDELKAQAYADPDVTETITVTRATWDSNSPGAELVVEARNFVTGAVLTVTYNGSDYTMTEDSPNHYSVTVGDSTYVATLDVTSDAGGSVTGFPVNNISAMSDIISVDYAQWDGNKPGTELYVRARNTQAGAVLTVTYNGSDYTMTEDSTNHYSVYVSDTTYVSTLDITSNLSGSVTNIPIINITAQAGHPHIVAGVRGSAYLGTLTCFKAGCHAENTYDEHLSPGGMGYENYDAGATPFECAFCHQYRPVVPGITFNDDTVIDTAISTGVDSELDVYCNDCHKQDVGRLDPYALGWDTKYSDANYSIAGRHHGSIMSRGYDCTDCHIDPRVAISAPTPQRLPCTLWR